MSDRDSTTRFLPVPGFPNYMIGDDGTLWGQSTWHKRYPPIVGTLGPRWHRINKKPGKNGYILVTLHRKPGNPRRCNIYLHTLVLEAFVGKCPHGMECCHDNGIRVDCRLSNLSWGTRLKNMQDKRRHGTQLFGERVPIAKLTDEKVVKLRRRRDEGLTFNQLAREFGISFEAARKVVYRRTWRHVP